MANPIQFNPTNPTGLMQDVGTDANPAIEKQIKGVINQSLQSEFPNLKLKCGLELASALTSNDWDHGESPTPEFPATSDRAIMDSYNHVYFRAQMVGRSGGETTIRGKVSVDSGQVFIDSE